MSIGKAFQSTIDEEKMPVCMFVICEYSGCVMDKVVWIGLKYCGLEYEIILFTILYRVISLAFSEGSQTYE